MSVKSSIASLGRSNEHVGHLFNFFRTSEAPCQTCSQHLMQNLLKWFVPSVRSIDTHPKLNTVHGSAMICHQLTTVPLSFTKHVCMTLYFRIATIFLPCEWKTGPSVRPNQKPPNSYGDGDICGCIDDAKKNKSVLSSLSPSKKTSWNFLTDLSAKTHGGSCWNFEAQTPRIGAFCLQGRPRCDVKWWTSHNWGFDIINIKQLPARIKNIIIIE